MKKLKNIPKDVRLRAVVIITALINQCLTSSGRHPLAIDNDTILEAASIVFTVIATTWGFWKDNDITSYAKKRKALGDMAMDRDREKEDI